MSSIKVPGTMPIVFQDCQALHHAFKGIGCNEKQVIEILGHRNYIQRRELVDAYRNMYGEELLARLEKELHGNFEKAVVLWMMDPSERDALWLKHSMKGLGTRDKTLTEIICTRTPSQLHYVKQLYQNKFHTSLDNDVHSETSGNYGKLLVAFLTSQRPETIQVDVVMAEADAKELYRGGEGKIGTDEASFIRIFSTRSLAQLGATFAAYHKLYGRGFDQAIKSETWGDFERAFCLVFEIATHPASYFAKVLYESMKGMGTNDSTLIRVVVSRAEIDMEMIKVEFQRAYHTSLESMLSDETSGHYRDFLLTLVGSWK